MKPDLHRLVATNVELAYHFPIEIRDEGLKLMGRACGFWPKKRIVIHPAISVLTLEEQNAVMLHEVGHCLLLHMERRLWLIPIFWTKWADRCAQEHEFEADAFVVGEGYGRGMVSFLHRDIDNPGRTFMPSNRRRIDAIVKLMREQIHVAQAA